MLCAPPRSPYLFRVGCSALGGSPCPIPALHTWLAAACFCERPGSRACRPAPFRASVEPRLRRCALGPPPVRLTLQSTRRCQSPPPPGASAPPAPCWAGARASAVQPLSIGSAVAVGLCLVSRSRPSIPPSPAPRRRPRAASGRAAFRLSRRLSGSSSAPKRTKPFFPAEGVGERTFLQDPKTGSAVGWPARSPPFFLQAARCAR